MAFYALSQLAQSKQPVSLSPQCGACGLFRKCNSPKMPVSGKGRRKILIVGEAPGEQEDQQNRAFVGRAGKIIRDAIRDMGFDPERDCWWTNALICRPPKNATPNNDQIGYCRPNLINTIRQLEPEIIIPAGAIAVRSLLGYVWRESSSSDSLERWLGWRIPSQKINAWICPNYHPMKVEYDRQERQPMTGKFFRLYLERAFELEGRPWKNVPNYAKKVSIEMDPRRVALILKMLRFQGNRIAFDYETNMIKPDHPKAYIRSCAVSDGGTTIAYPWVGQAIDATLEMLEDKAVEKIGFNLKFEHRWTKTLYGVTVKNWIWCGMTGAHVLDNRDSISSLKFQSFVLLGQDSYDDHIHQYLKSKVSTGYGENRIKEIAIEDLLLYNGLDALLEFKVGTIQMEALYGNASKG